MAAGEKLKLLFAGYNGTRNMGSDVRVDEMLRQIRHILGAEQGRLQRDDQNFELPAKDISKARAGASAGYFSSVPVATKFQSITAWWPAKVRCSRANSPTL